MKYNKQLTKDYEQACANMCCANAAEDEYGCLCAIRDLMKWARLRTESGYSIRETYKKIIPQLVKGAFVIWDSSDDISIRRSAFMLERAFPTTVVDDFSAVVNLSIFFNTLQYVLIMGGYDETYISLFNECAEFDENGIVNLYPIRYNPNIDNESGYSEAGTK